jgi:SpoIID/LytB domain protein
MKYIIIISLIFLNIKNTFSQNLFEFEPQVRVRIIDSLSKLETSFEGNWMLTAGDYLQRSLPENGPVEFFIVDSTIQIKLKTQTINTIKTHLTLICNSGAGTMTIKSIPYGIGWWWEGKEDRIYEGEINIYVNGTETFDVIVKLPLEQYLKGVVPYEMGNDSPLEALKAQAVAARSEAIIALTSKLYSGNHHDITSDVECQVFSGNHKRTSVSDRAVEETVPLILSENGKPINAYYASNCGGHSELIANIWPDRPEPESYKLAGRDSQERVTLDLQQENDVRQWIFSEPDVYCNPELGLKLPAWSQKNFRWKKVINVVELSKMIAGKNFWGELLNFKILRRGISGRINLVSLIFEKDSIQVQGELAIRQLWRPALRSSCFVIDRESGNFILHGAGWGHGVGMCQSGAIAQANKGATFEEILRHYYQKADLMILY